MLATGTFTFNRRDLYRYARREGLPRWAAAWFAVKTGPMKFRGAGHLAPDGHTVNLDVAVVK